MFSFFKSKQVVNHPFSTLGVDMHSHLIPGIDDGAKDMEDSLAIIEQLRDLGYKKIITTPHTYEAYYPNTAAVILEGLENLRNALEKAGIEVEVSAASEYFMDEHFESLLEKKELMTLGETNFVLVEMSFFGAPPALEEYIFQMRLAGYHPVLAHPERYAFFANKFKYYERLVELGCALQINALSLTGHYGALARKTAEKLLKKEMVTFFGTDCHNLGHTAQLQQLARSGKWQKYKDYPFQNADL
ncbi:MAG: hypothetical protein KDC85_20105 [Saprospiraceae bacterium]|nr:hypothetical protein [Saprospiraceae bacterium]MCB9322681.1 hypothetical protein [Lewinellaceae bacterium]